ncbi:MAG: hypothetical protein IMX02_02770 [Limnochordaceae bacterium]|nr:hypothetical protein [Limnochordaceae bacterium]
MGSRWVRQACRVVALTATATLSWTAPTWPAERPAGRVLPAAKAAFPAAEARPTVLRGVYMPPGRLLRGIGEGEWRALSRAGLNAIVVDVRDDRGKVTLRPWETGDDTARGEREGSAPRVVVRQARAHGMVPVARIVALRDETTGPDRPQLFLLGGGGEPWVGPAGERWLDPRSSAVRTYLAYLARMAADAGFAEIHLDYVRFPSEGGGRGLARPGAAERVAAIQQLVAGVREALEGTGATLSVAIFGQACSVPGDMGIGQQCEAMASAADVLAPMVYPSHFGPGVFGIPVPEREPARTVALALAATGQRVGRARVRPWLQAFSLRVTYGPVELAAQIEAAEQAGTAGWFLWNPSGRYPYLAAATTLVRESPGMVPSRAAVTGGWSRP